MYVSTEDGSPLPVIDFSLKGAVITADFFFSPLLGNGAAGGEILGREKEIASGPGNSNRRGYVGEAEGETESETECYSSLFLVLI